MSVFFGLVRGVLALAVLSKVAPGQKMPRKPLQHSGVEVSRDCVRLGARGGFGPRGEVCQYRSVQELKVLWQFHDRCEESDSLTVVLVLDGTVKGSLRDLIRRTQWGERLIIVTEPDSWPGSDSLGDLALSTPRLGWGTIRACRDVGEAIAECTTDRVLVFLPKGTLEARAADAGDLARRIM